tara:strand:+ start:121 stop:1206 length:1086 start_codon:yes stop_codon:yes gene_type:complete
MADLIPEEDLVLTISHGGYAKTQQLDVYQAQRRGGKGKSAASVKDDDYVEHLMIANSHDTVLCFTDAGKVFWLKVYDIPQAGRNAKGRPMVNVVNLGDDERITAILPLPEFTGEEFIFMATSMGTVKKTSLEHFQRPRSSGLIACELDDGDHLIGVAITDGTKDILLLTDAGKANRFKESDVRAMGRTARGVRGIRIQEGQNVISLVIPEEGGTLLTASDRGYGKRTEISEFPTKGRGTQGVKAMVVNERNGIIIGAVQVFENDEVMLISDKGTLVRTSADSVSCLGRNTQGVRLIKVAEKERLIGVERVCEPEDVDDGIEYLAADGTQTESSDVADSVDASDTSDVDAGQINDDDMDGEA